MKGSSLRVIVVLAAVALLSGSVATNAQVAALGKPRQACSNPTNQMTLFAERLGPTRVGYGRTPKGASIPGPTITMTEGDCLAINLINDTNRPVSLHVHGVAYSPASDGTAVNHGCVSPGKSRTYVWNALQPGADSNGNLEPGSRGYWPYHDHCMGGPHGTLGIESGLFGALIVRAPNDPTPDRPPFVIVMSPGFTINLRRAPYTPIFKANLGERVEFVVIGMGDDFHTFHLHGHRWVDNRTGIPTSPADDSPVIDNKTLGPADSFGFFTTAGYQVGPGAWMYHCHVQAHSDLGMSGLFVVRKADGTMTPQEKRAIARWKKLELEHRHMLGGHSGP
jgi:FtsP/CotA-like multicopper oxidase with cupredoxin domain